MDLPTAEWRDITLYLPSYCSIEELYIGVGNTSDIAAPQPYRESGKIVYYGSSITQGACASRPGNTYENILSRRLSMDYINLGFSGNAKAEDSIAEYIKELDMRLFVYDYDWNSPDVNHLKVTHERMFKVIRESKPDMPVIIMSRPKCHLSCEENERLEIIRKTYENAKASGDNNVYLIEGKTLMSLAGDDGLVDGVHPNDLGFYSMANILEPVIKELLKQQLCR